MKKKAKDMPMKKYEMDKMMKEAPKKKTKKQKK